MTKETLLNLKETLACKEINLIQVNDISKFDEVTYEVIDDVTLILNFTKNNYDLIHTCLSKTKGKIYAVGGSTSSSYMWLKFTIIK